MHTRGVALRKFVAPEIMFGDGALRLAGQYGRNLGGNKALIVSDPGVLAAGWVQQVLASIGDAGLESTLFTRVTPNPRIEEVAAGAVVYAEQGCDIIVAVGGGSVIDCAKGIGLLAANQGGIRDLVGVDNVSALATRLRQSNRCFHPRPVTRRKSRTTSRPPLPIADLAAGTRSLG